MKIHSHIVVALLIGAFIFSGCRKGSEDPAISLKSRKARLAGKWVIKEGKVGTSIIDSKSRVKYDYILGNSGQATIYETPTGQSVVIYKMLYSLTLDISKDGTFSISEQAGVHLLEASGTWNFTGKIGDAKNKDGVVFVIDKVSKGDLSWNMFNKFTNEFTYKLVELRSSEVKLNSETKPVAGTTDKSITLAGSFTLVH